MAGIKIYSSLLLSLLGYASAGFLSNGLAVTPQMVWVRAMAYAGFFLVTDPQLGQLERFWLQGQRGPPSWHR